MKLYTKLLRSELSAISKLSDICPLDKSRIAMDKMGKALTFRHRKCVSYKDIGLAKLRAEYIIPRSPRHEALILYLHGGGYVLGSMDYARGFGTLIAAETSIKVCCLEYRLAPEHRFPAALDDAYYTYRFLIESGFPSERIVLCGESAGGGLIYALSLKLKAEGCPMPRGIIALSPWSDLTLSGSSYEFNRANDPSMTEKRLRFYAESYSEQFKDPYVSPLFGDLTGLPPSMILAGGHEIMLSDSMSLHEKLLSCGCGSTLHIAPEMWHVYLMYKIAEAKNGFNKINDFIGELFNDQYGGTFQ